MRDFKDRMNDVGCETFINVLYPELKRYQCRCSVFVG